MPDPLQAHPSKPIRDAIAKREQEREAVIAAEWHEAFERKALSASDDAFGAIPPLLPSAEPDESSQLSEATEPQSPDPEAAPAVADDEPSERELSGKRVVLMLDTEGSWQGWADTEGTWQGWAVLADIDDRHVHTPRLYEGNRDEAIRAALEDEFNETIADRVRADPARFLFVSVPASSWAPAPVKPRVTKTTWVIQR